MPNRTGAFLLVSAFGLFAQAKHIWAEDLVYAESSVLSTSLSDSQVERDEAYWKDKYLGDVNFEFNVLRYNGEPAEGVSFTIKKYLKDLGKRLALYEGQVSADGVAKVTGLMPDHYNLFINDIPMKVVNVTAGRLNYELTLKIPPQAGDIAPDFEMTSLMGNQKSLLSDFRGQIVLLDFWASWCGPCQPEMSKYEEIMNRRKDWENKALIIGVSVDKNISTIREHVAKRQWHSVFQAWVPGGMKGKTGSSYSLFGIPSLFLINHNGEITWTEIGGIIDLEDKIDALIKSQ